LVLDDAAGQSATRIKVQTGRRFDSISNHILFCVQFGVRVSHVWKDLSTEKSNPPKMGLFKRKKTTPGR